jgi:RNA polymerase sigma-70 factor (ECF subfamily)
MKNHQDQFDRQLISLLPRLRVQALALTRNASAAGDLVQDAVTNALAARGSFTPGTNFAAWMHRILRNRFISDMRKRRPHVDLDDVPQAALATPAVHENSLVLKELNVALGRLPLVQRESLFMVVLHGMSYEQVAESLGCAVGTAKSRVFRARQQLQAWLTGEPAPASQPWSEGEGADVPAHLPATAAFTAGARQAGLIRLSGDAAC